MLPNSKLEVGVNEISAVSDMILESRKTVVFTGAGISTESGVSDFRSPGGIWDKFDLSELNFHSFLTSETSREKYWDFYKQLWPTMVEAEPNSGHYAIAELYHLGKLDCYWHAVSSSPFEACLSVSISNTPHPVGQHATPR